MTDMQWLHMQWWYVYLLHPAVTIIGWEAYKWLKKSWNMAQFKCPYCDISVSSTDRSFIESWGQEHLKMTHPSVNY